MLPALLSAVSAMLVRFELGADLRADGRRDAPPDVPPPVRGSGAPPLGIERLEPGVSSSDSSGLAVRLTPAAWPDC